MNTNGTKNTKPTTALVPFEKQILAKLDTETLAETIQGCVHKAQQAEKEAYEAYHAAERGTPEKAYALQRLREAAKTIDDYIEEQKAMFQSRGLPTNYYFNNAIVPTGEVLPNGVEMLRIVKRPESLRPFDVEEAIAKSDDDEMNDREERDFEEEDRVDEETAREMEGMGFINE